MQHISTDHVKQTLFASIDSLLSRRDEFLVNPQSSFTRVKKISFTQTILFPMVAGADNSSSRFGYIFLSLQKASVSQAFRVSYLDALQQIIRS